MASDKPLHKWLLILQYVLVSAMVVSTWAGDTDANVLIRFKGFLQSDGNALDNWNASNPLCSWTGVVCVHGGFYGLRLENMGLTGTIDVETLAQLSVLRSFSVINNSFRGPIPEVKKLRGLRSLFLSDNKFEGELEDGVFEGMKFLKKVHLARNGFVGKVPKTLAGLDRIMELDLRQNQFKGKIPGFRVTKDWKVMNLSYNQFHGRIPKSLSFADPSAFLGNIDLCGKPLVACKSSNSNKRTIIIAAAGAAAAILVIAAILVFLRTRKSRTTESKVGEKAKPIKALGKEDQSSISESSHNYIKYKSGGGHGELHFVKNDRERFELEDLLRASAEVLGSGSFGSSYKAVLHHFLSGSALVVKRFRHMNNLGKDEFHQHMGRLGKLSHPNLHPLIAFYYRRDEKLLVSDYVENGSLARHLHGKRAPGQAGLDWPTRLNIIKGVARGLGYLCKEFKDKISVPHGHLKSSNVLLDQNFNPILTEYGLVPAMNREHAQKFMAAYKSPELAEKEKARVGKSDVWSLGILILEVLTGRFPENYVKGGSDLGKWVESVVREEWTGEVFDKDMKGTKNGEGEMVKLLKIGLCCCDGNVETRWGWSEALEKIEELKERDDSDGDSSSYATDWDVYSSRPFTQDAFSFSVVG